MSEDHGPQGDGKGSGERRRGRPRIGDANTIRLPEKQHEFALNAGGGKLPEGVRLAVQTLMTLGKPLDLTEYELAYAAAYGGGFVADGLQQLLRERERELPYADIPRRRKKRLDEPPDPLRRVLDERLVQVALQLGKGDLAAGIHRSLRVSQMLGVETVKKMDHGPEDS